MADDRLTIDPALVQGLIATQFPQWAELPVRPVQESGWDNRSFRLGDDLAVRLPSHRRYEAAVAKEQHWLPVLAPQLPLPIPAPVGRGVPGPSFPMPWSVNRWLPGGPATSAPIDDRTAFARDLAAFLRALRAADASGGPAAGDHNFHRGGALGVYDPGTRQALVALAGEIDTGTATAIWEEALGSSWQGAPVWVHGDVAVGNLLVTDGRLSAVIDFGTSGVGDPACDLVMAWTFFTGHSRAAFQDAVGLDADTWARARGWALWKALITLAADRDRPSRWTRQARSTLDALLTEPGRR